MVLNSDCVRDLLLSIESNEYGEQTRMKTLSERLSNYSESDISYTCLKLEEAGFLRIVTTRSLGSAAPIIVAVNDLTYSGHEFLNTVREDKNWKTVKETAKKAGVFSLKAISQISEAVAAAAITAALQSRL